MHLTILEFFGSFCRIVFLTKMTTKLKQHNAISYERECLIQICLRNNRLVLK